MILYPVVDSAARLDAAAESLLCLSNPAAPAVPAAQTAERDGCELHESPALIATVANLTRQHVHRIVREQS